MKISATLVLLAIFTVSASAGSNVCELSPEIRAEVTRAANVAASLSDFDKHVAPFLALRQRYPNDLLVHERYQDAVQQYGIEGHLRKLTEEYQVLAMQHSDEFIYSYMYARSLIGRNTPSAIQQINSLLSEHPDFAPAHGSLAEIYASTAFHDSEKAGVEGERFLQLCPGSKLQQRPGSLLGPTPLIDQAEHSLQANGAPDSIMAMAQQGIRDDEWRLQRIRPFDWYSVDYKRQAQRELQARYWQMWSIQVRCERRAGRQEKAAALLAAMDQRAQTLEREANPTYWTAVTTIVRLYEEGNQKQSATQMLDSMEQFLAKHPDSQRSSQLEELRKMAGQNK
jgi:hypothetical protein